MVRKAHITLLILLAPLAAGHAVPYESEPTAGARLDEAPLEVIVRFTEPVFEDGTWIRVYDAEGNRVDDDNLDIQFGNRPVLTLGTEGLGHGAYRIQWQTYSQTDGHTVGGSIGFAVGSFAPPPTETTGEDATRAWGIVARSAQYLGYVLIGAAVVGQWLQGPEKRLLVSGAILQVIGHTTLFVDTAAATGLGASYLTSQGGTDLAIRTVAWAMFPLLAVTLRFTRFILPGAALLALSDARFGHGSQQGAWAIGIEWIHLMAISVWIGGLLWLILRGSKSHGPQFGRIALWSVIAIAFTGFALSVGILGDKTLDAGRTAGTIWGKLLFAKIGLMAGMIALAAVNRYGILGKDGEPLAWLRNQTRNWSFRRVVGTEAAVGFVTVLVAGALLSVGAPAAIAEVQPIYQEDAEDFRVGGTITISPLPVASQDLLLRVFLVEEAPVTNNTCGKPTGCITASWYHDESGELTAESAVLEREGDGWWRFENLLFLQPGNHTMQIHVNTAWSQETLQVTVPVQ